MGKTGTTSLQNYFWAHRDDLYNRGILYPKLGVVAGAHHLLSPHVPVFLKGVWKFIPAEEWAAKLSRQADRTVLLSSELTSNALPEVVEAFAPHVKRYFNPKIIIYLRRQDNWMIAGFGQQVKAGTQRLDFTSSFAPWFQRADYNRVVGSWAKAFGKENIIVRPYERRQLIDGDIRADFMTGILGLEDWARPQQSERNENPRLTFAALEYKRFINNIIEDTQVSNQFNKPLLDYSAEVDGNSTAIFHESDLLSGTERRMILERTRATNQWIARDFLGRPDGVLFKDPEPAADASWAPPKVDPKDFLEIGAYLKANGHEKELWRHIERSTKENRFEEYRYARELARTLGQTV